MSKKENFIRKKFTWPICKKLLLLVLEDKVSDVFVCELVWERLFYTREKNTNDWIFSELTPSFWSEKFVKAPKIISERIASVHLTRSIPKEHKKGLKNFLNFKGYKINELYPRRTRRATAVNWLIYWSIESNSFSIKEDKLPAVSSPSVNPAKGHLGDPEIK
ncbi:MULTISPECIES: DUF1823 family protein [Prochlorococcus]|uniref:DUF1823 domain-containing protein n=1 Tax=Prochlorococcus marinus str. MIT 9116 TaxID=167544 RepID=A0A0A1ZSH9_PROMR|nr:DUF1823 family protein [Prochlorococcus marinus]KGF90194.1 hypothetical protein EU92_1146 [Prochlorococcus marinus str. MIT 9107]KGF91219.1 hypothetical protein EU93_1158 [Prochlorococcus marinus str. MIT 9116]KGF94867.1 hypothetical protein EU94_0481 [Prochlorococcus marinus str. MIT 9123]